MERRLLGSETVPVRYRDSQDRSSLGCHYSITFQLVYVNPQGEGNPDP